MKMGKSTLWVVLVTAMAALGATASSCGSGSGTNPNGFLCCNSDFQAFSCTQEKPECAGCTRDQGKDAECR
jgi:hypothetical protein